MVYYPKFYKGAPVLEDITNFGKFLFTGSYDPAIEAKLREHKNKNDSGMDPLVTTVFTEQKYNYNDLAQIKKVVESAMNQKFQHSSDETIKKQEISLHDGMVTLSFPNIAYYRRQYGMLKGLCTRGIWFVSILTIVDCISSLVVYRSLKLLPFKRIALSLLSCGALIWRGSLANDYYKIASRCTDLATTYATKIKAAREKGYCTGNLPSETSKDKAFSPRELEIITLNAIYKKANSRGLNNSSLSLVIDTSYQPDPAKAVTDEKKAIDTYLLKLSCHEWLKGVTADFKQLITKDPWASKELCVRAIDGILSKFIFGNCLSRISIDNQNKVVNELKTYLEGREKRDPAAKLNEDNIEELTKPVKEKIRKKMAKAIENTKIPLNEIKNDDTFWAKWGFKPQTLEWASQ